MYVSLRINARAVPDAPVASAAMIRFFSDALTSEASQNDTATLRAARYGRR